MFISIYFKTSSCDSDPGINNFIYGPPPSINSAAVSSSRWTAFRLDTWKLGSPPLSGSLLFPSVAFLSFFCFFPLLPLTAFSVAVQWEVTGHSKPRLAAAPLVILWLWLTPLPRSCAPPRPLPPHPQPHPLRLAALWL